MFRNFNTSVSPKNTFFKILYIPVSSRVHFYITFDEEVQQIQNSNRIPLIFIDSYSNVRQLINIGIDDYKGGQLAADYFF